MKKLQFELSIADVANIVTWIPEIIEKGVPAKDAAVFRRLERELLKSIKKGN